MKLEFAAKVDNNGQMRIINRKDFDVCIASSFLGKEVVLTIEGKRRKRSSQFNRYYWSAVIPIIRAAFIDLGSRVTVDETHDFLKEKFIIGEALADREGVFIGTIRKTTTTLSPSEFSDYISDIRQWAAEILNCNIPEPNEQVTIAELDEEVNAIKSE